MKQDIDKDESQRMLSEILARYGLVVTGVDANGTVTVAEGPAKDEPPRSIN